MDLKGSKEIQTIEILNPYQIPHKETSLDVRATDKRGVTFIVEMQVEQKPFLRQKVSFSSAKAVRQSVVLI